MSHQNQEHASDAVLPNYSNSVLSLSHWQQVVQVFTNRSTRVILLLIIIALMSVADLYLTLLFVTKTGMNEMNPLARAMMEYQSPAILAVWKLATVILSVGILLIIRKKRSAELGAWVGCLVLGWLMIHWVGFVQESTDLKMELAQSMDETTWIEMPVQAEGSDLPGAWMID